MPKGELPGGPVVYFPGRLVVKNPPANAGDTGSIPGSGSFSGKGDGNPLQYSCLENPIDRSLVGYSPWDCKRVEHDLATKQQQQQSVVRTLHFDCREPRFDPWLGN